MTTTTRQTPTTTTEQAVPTSVAMRFEVTTLPVADVDSAKAFYLGLGWHLDIDFMPDENTRVVQITPTGSAASIQFDSGRSTMTPGVGSLQFLYLIVDDIVAARADLISHGAAVSEIWHNEPGKGKVSGVDPERRSYNSYTTFSDPDDNTWLVQELTQRLPGRVRLLDAPNLAERLHETSLRHGAFEAVAPPHNWWDWYAAYLDAREHGANPDEASALANNYMAEVKGVVVPAE